MAKKDKTTKKVVKKKGITKERLLEALDEFANGIELKDVIASLGVSRSTFYYWIDEKYELSVQYARARTIYCNGLMEHIDLTVKNLEKGLIDSASANVIINTDKWKLSKFYPKMFGEKMDVTSDGEKIGHGTIEMINNIKKILEDKK